VLLSAPLGRQPCSRACGKAWLASRIRRRNPPRIKARW
jgi:hypothetical protein